MRIGNCVLQAEHSQPKRVTQDIAINKHAFIRVHVHPKRFPAVYTVDWKVNSPSNHMFSYGPCLRHCHEQDKQCGISRLDSAPEHGAHIQMQW